MRMRWIVAGRCVVLLDIERARQRDLDRPPSPRAPQRRQQRVGAHEQLAAEAAADDRARSAAPSAWRMPSVLARSPHAPVDHLVRGPQGQLVALPGGDRRMRLHHRVRLVGRGVGLVELHRRARRRRSAKSPTARVAARRRFVRLAGAVLGRREIEGALRPRR